jgi:ubiquitin C-terminal hydrolase
MKQLKDNEEELKKFEVLALHGKEKKYYQLKLKAIIIHSGTPDVGHYYTIVKRDSNWFKYDDSRVTLFSSMSFDEECYGGTSVADEWGDPRSTSSKNAYVLVY